MKTSVIKKEVYTLIDNIPEQKLAALKPLLTFLTNEPIIETDLTVAEREIIRKGRKEYKEHPENFVDWDDVKDTI